MPAKPKSPSIPKPAKRPRREAIIYQFLIALAETNPLVWRRIQVPAAYSFWDLHVAIQDAMGWLDCHLHEFRLVHPKRRAVERIGIPGDEFMDEVPCQAGWQVRIASYFDHSHALPPARYEYDFGDSWQHVVICETMWSGDAGAYPRCIGGAQKCPPEDCGGPHGYVEFLEAIGNPRHPEHDQMIQWCGGQFDPNAFDPAAVVFDDPRKRWKTAFGDRNR